MGPRLRRWTEELPAKTRAALLRDISGTKKKQKKEGEHEDMRLIVKVLFYTFSVIACIELLLLFNMETINGLIPYKIVKKSEPEKKIANW